MKKVLKIHIHSLSHTLSLSKPWRSFSGLFFYFCLLPRILSAAVFFVMFEILSSKPVSAGNVSTPTPLPLLLHPMGQSLPSRCLGTVYYSSSRVCLLVLLKTVAAAAAGGVRLPRASLCLH